MRTVLWNATTGELWEAALSNGSDAAAWEQQATADYWEALRQGSQPAIDIVRRNVSTGWEEEEEEEATEGWYGYWKAYERELRKTEAV